MFAATEEHVADSGAVYCGWRGRQLPVGFCEKCPAYRETALRAASTAHPVKIVRCTEPIPLA